jgi:UDP-2,4-diacetamido-2,4,6-trideoxy-beta-L-altropyranose hydrolase
LNKKNLRTRILFRTEASPLIGMGHLIRCISLAKILQPNFDILFLLSSYVHQVEHILKTEGFSYAFLNSDSDKELGADEETFYDKVDMVVLDGYNFRSEDQKHIKDRGKKLVFIDDLHNQHFYADAVFNVSDSVSKTDYETEPYTQLFLGSAYTLLREVFLKEAKKPGRKISAIDTLFVSMGAADLGNVSLKVLKAIELVPEIKTVHVILGAVNPNEITIEAYIKNNRTGANISLYKNIDALKMNELLNKSQIAVCPASGICMEASSVGIGLISGLTASNQSGILNGLIERKCAINAGDLNTIKEDELASTIRSCTHQTELVNEMITNQKKLIDGLSPQRIEQIFQKLANEN